MSGDGGCKSRRMSSSQNLSPRLFPCKINRKGRYGYSVEWRDGATIIYSMISLAKAAGAKLQPKSI